MAPDPITAIGLAANILHFIEFTCGLVADAKEIYHSATGATAENIELQTIAESLSQLSSSLSSRGEYEGHPASTHEISTLAASCKAVADELLSAIKDLQVKDGAHRRWQSFRQALRTIWKKDDITKFQQRLELYRSHLSIHILSHINVRQNEVMQHLERVQQECKSFTTSTQDKIEPLLESLRSIMVCGHDINRQQLADIDSRLIRSDEVARILHIEIAILRSLMFDRMSARYSAIVEAHTRTFEWMFTPSQWPPSDPRSQVGFHDWLTHGNGIYWISGKPGSGKSTLMKYIYDYSQTRNCLKVWAGDVRLATASFFFWIAGTDMQKSQQGLLRQLLFEILKSCPDWISILCPERAENLIQADWSLPELKRAFDRLSTLTTDSKATTKFCIFIDGLDEYNGDHLDLIKTIECMGRLDNIKLCVSSRPWNCFEDAFGRDARRKLYLQDLTRDDIAAYARDKLTEVQERYYTAENIIQFEGLVTEIVSRAEGVFLWVFLVARSLREGILNGDSPSLLRERLLEMPSDLEEFFEKLIKSVNRIYRRRMAYTFQVALAAKSPLRLLLYSFIDERDSCPSFQERKRKSTIASKSDVKDIEAIMNRQLNGRYKGLLESHGDPGYKEVHFLHRTVRDFLITREIQRLFASYSEPNFNPYVCICEAFILQTRTFPDRVETVHLEDFLRSAKAVDQQLGDVCIPLLEDMNTAYYSQSPQMKDSFSAPDYFPISLLARTITSGPVSYFHFRLQKNPELALRHPSPLTLCLRPWFVKNVPVTEFQSLHGIIELLLRYGANPNQMICAHHAELAYIRDNDETNEEDYTYPYSENQYDERSVPKCMKDVNHHTPILHALVDKLEDPRWPFEWNSRLLITLLAHGAKFREDLISPRFLSRLVYVAQENAEPHLLDLFQKLYSLLFDRGLRPESFIGDYTLWYTFLHYLTIPLFDAPRPETQKFSLDMIKLFLQRGANPHIASYSIDSSGSDINVLSAISGIFPDNDKLFYEATTAVALAVEAWDERPSQACNPTTKRKQETTDHYDRQVSKAKHVRGEQSKFPEQSRKEDSKHASTAQRPWRKDRRPRFDTERRRTKVQREWS